MYIIVKIGKGVTRILNKKRKFSFPRCVAVNILNILYATQRQLLYICNNFNVSTISFCISKLNNRIKEERVNMHIIFQLSFVFSLRKKFCHDSILLLNE